MDDAWTHFSIHFWFIPSCFSSFLFFFIVIVNEHLNSPHWKETIISGKNQNDGHCSERWLNFEIGIKPWRDGIYNKEGANKVFFCSEKTRVKIENLFWKIGIEHSVVIPHPDCIVKGSRNFEIFKITIGQCEAHRRWDKDKMHWAAKVILRPGREKNDLD